MRRRRGHPTQQSPQSGCASCALPSRATHTANATGRRWCEPRVAVTNNTHSDCRRLVGSISEQAYNGAQDVRCRRGQHTPRSQETEETASRALLWRATHAPSNRLEGAQPCAADWGHTRSNHHKVEAVVAVRGYSQFDPHKAKCQPCVAVAGETHHYLTRVTCAELGWKDSRTQHSHQVGSSACLALQSRATHKATNGKVRGSASRALPSREAHTAITTIGGSVSRALPTRATHTRWC